MFGESFRWFREREIRSSNIGLRFFDFDKLSVREISSRPVFELSCLNKSWDFLLIVEVFSEENSVEIWARD